MEKSMPSEIKKLITDRTQMKHFLVVLIKKAPEPEGEKYDKERNPEEIEAIIGHNYHIICHFPSEEKAIEEAAKYNDDPSISIKIYPIELCGLNPSIDSILFVMPVNDHKIIGTFAVEKKNVLSTIQNSIALMFVGLIENIIYGDTKSGKYLIIKAADKDTRSVIYLS